jgi:hypothetical protein
MGIAEHARGPKQQNKNSPEKRALKKLCICMTKYMQNLI